MQLSNDSQALHFRLVLNVVESGVAAELHRDKPMVGGGEMSRRNNCKAHKVQSWGSGQKQISATDLLGRI